MGERYIVKSLLSAIIVITSIGVISQVCYAKTKEGAPKKQNSATESKPVKETPGEKSFSVEITLANGSVEKVNKFRSTWTSYSSRSIITTNISTEIEVISHDFTVKIGPYDAIVPFEIIKKVSIENGNANFLLGNGSEIKVEMNDWFYFKGNTDLGETGFELKNIKMIVFNHNALEKYNEPAFGVHKAILHKSNDETVKITGAGFRDIKENGNGCFLGYKCVEKLGFKVEGGGTYEILWDKIVVIIPEPKVYDKFKLVTKEGKELLGSRLGILNVMGIVNLNGAYNLLADIPLDMPLNRDTYTKLELK